MFEEEQENDNIQTKKGALFFRWKQKNVCVCIFHPVFMTGWKLFYMNRLNHLKRDKKMKTYRQKIGALFLIWEQKRNGVCIFYHYILGFYKIFLSHCSCDIFVHKIMKWINCVVCEFLLIFSNLLISYENLSISSEIFYVYHISVWLFHMIFHWIPACHLSFFHMKICYSLNNFLMK